MRTRKTRCVLRILLAVLLVTGRVLTGCSISGVGNVEPSLGCSAGMMSVVAMTLQAYEHRSN